MSSSFISNVAQEQKRLDELIKRKVTRTAQKYERHWQAVIRESSPSGEVYPVASGSKTTYTASAPDQPPAIRTAALVKGATHEIEKTGLLEYKAKIGPSVESGRGSPQGASARSIADDLEFGTTKMAARPSWRPALERLRQDTSASIDKE